MVIGITGKKGSGKDVLGSYFVDECQFQLYKFAEPIKNMCRDIFLWDDTHVDGTKKEQIDPRWGISPRQAQQFIGTELFREKFREVSKTFNDRIANNIWVKRFEYMYKAEKLDNKRMYLQEPNYVITDVRFLNEADAVHSLGGKIIQIKCEKTIGNDTHASETEMDYIVPDYIISNNGTLTELHDKFNKVRDDIGLT
jgi:dephospho-CoA kinase